MGLLSDVFESRSHPQNVGDFLVKVFGGEKTASGIRVNEEESLEYSAVLAAVRIISETVAMLPLITYERMDRGKRRANDHSLYNVLKTRPNPEMTSFQWRENQSMHLLLWGNAYSEIVWSGGGDVLQLWPLTPKRVTPKRPDPTQPLVYEVSLPNGGRRMLQARNVLHTPGLSMDGVEGMSLIRLMRESIGLGLATEEFGARFFANDARPGIVLSHPDELSDQAVSNLRGSWESQHQGLSKKHRVAILEEGMDIHEVGIPPEDAQFLQTRQFQVSDVARWTRIPEHMLAVMDNATFSNIEHQSMEFVVHTMMPWLKRFEQSFQAQLLTSRQQDLFFVEFLVDGLLRGDIETRYNAYAQGRQWGWLSANDVREKENLNPIDGGDTYLQPMNMVPAGTNPVEDEDVRKQLVEDLTRHTRPTGEIEQAREGREARAKRSARMRREIANSWRPAIRDTAARIIRREEADIMREAKKLFRRNEVQFDAFVDDFYEEHKSFVEDNMRPVFAGLSDAAKAEAAEEVSADPDIDLNMFVDEYLRSFSRRHAGASAGQVKEVAGEALVAGEDPVEALQARFDEWSETRPAKIARWESNQVMNATSHTVYQRAGIMQERWRAFGENCPFCARLNGQTIETNSNFINQGEEFEGDGDVSPLVPEVNIGHPPAHQGCDCAISAA